MSVTDRCNLRCAYCMPEDGGAPAPMGLLSLQELLLIARAAARLGITHVRLTGGEPLVRPDVPLIIAGLKAAGVPDISMTTNGTLLARYAKALKAAGLARVNVSLDSLRPEVFRSMTRNGDVSAALSGIRAAIDAGLSPVKVNAVVVKGVNDDEVGDLARLSIELPIQVRFIEVMPIGPDSSDSNLAVSMDVVKDRVQAALGRLEPVSGVTGAGPAEVFTSPGAAGTVGFIAPLSHPFCASCNRLRLTPDGKLRPCLASDVEVDLLPALRGKAAVAESESRLSSPATVGAVVDDLEATFREALRIKPKGHDLWNHSAHSRRMCQIGG